MDIKEQFKNLLPGVDISDEFVTELTASIETAVAQRVEEETATITEEANRQIKELSDLGNQYSDYVMEQFNEIHEKANAYAEYVVESMTQKVEDYCEYVVNEFIETNQKKLVETEEYCRMAKVLNTIRETFEANYFLLDSEEPVTVELESRLMESKQEFNQLFEEHRKLKRQIEDYSNYIESENRKAVFEQTTQDLADTQKDRLTRLVERAEFPDIESYRKGLEIMVEELLLSGKKRPSIITEEKPASHSKSSFDDKMRAYLDKL